MFHVTKTCRDIFDQKCNLKTYLYSTQLKTCNFNICIQYIVGCYHANFYMSTASFEYSTAIFLKNGACSTSRVPRHIMAGTTPALLNVYYEVIMATILFM